MQGKTEERLAERRRSPRIQDGIKVRMTGESFKRFGSVVNTSLHGMLVRTKKYFCPVFNGDVSLSHNALENIRLEDDDF